MDTAKRLLKIDIGAGAHIFPPIDKVKYISPDKNVGGDLLFKRPRTFLCHWMTSALVFVY